MNMAMPMQYSIPGGAVAFTGSSSKPDPFDKSPLNPVNMSRTADRTTSGSAPSSKLLDRVRVAACDLAELACVQAGWRYVTEKGNTTIYEMNGAVLPSTVSVAASFGGAGGKASDYYLVKGVTTVSVDVDHVLELLAAPATEAFALRMNQIFGKQFYQNGVVIDQLSCTEPPAQFRSQDGSVRSYTQDDAYAVNWLSLKTASVTEGARDFTVASYQDAFQRDARGGLVRLGRRAARDPPRRGDATDRLLGVHALTSFNFKDVPALPKSKNTERLHFRNTGFVVEETHERGVFRLSFFLSLMPVAATLRSPKKYEKWLQGLALCVGNLALQAKPQQVLSHAKKTTWKDSDHCMLCLKSFYAFRRCHHCRFCGEAVCNKCSGFVDVSKFDVVQTLSGSMRPAANPSLSDHYSETRGCSRCIRQLMEDYANSSTTNVSLVGGLDSQRRSSTTGSRSSGRSSKHSSSFLNNPQLVAPSDDEDAISLSGSSDRLSSDSFSGPSAYQRPQPNVINGFANGVARQRSDFEESESPAAKSQASFAKPPLHVDAKLSMSTASTSFSNPSFADDRVSAASHLSQQRWNPNMSAGPTLGSGSGSNARPMDFQSDYLSDDDVLNLTGLSIHNDSHQHQNPYSQSQPQLHDDETDIDAPPMFARSMISAKCLSISKTSAPSATKDLPPRSTVSSSRSGDSGSNSFKFSMMSQNLSLSSEPEIEPHAQDSFTGGYVVEPNVRSSRLPDSSRGTATSSSSSKLFSMSAGPRLHSQSIPQQRPPRPLPAFYQEPARSSSSGSSRASLPMSEDMFMLPPAAMAMAAAGPSESDHSDMILLAPKRPQTPQFVEFSDSHRESIFVRPGDGSDMIPLKF